KPCRALRGSPRRRVIAPLAVDGIENLVVPFGLAPWDLGHEGDGDALVAQPREDRREAGAGDIIGELDVVEPQRVSTNRIGELAPPAAVGGDLFADCTHAEYRVAGQKAPAELKSSRL